MSLFNFNEEELLTFFAVLVRFSVLFSILPFVGDRVIPGPVKILLALLVSVVLFPGLVASHQVNVGQANIWARSTGGIISTITLESLFGLLLGYVARLLFEGISFGANLIGNFMGFASATTFDPHQESQTEIVAQFQTSLAMLIFLALNGHHLMLRSVLDSYKIVGIGGFSLTSALMDRLIHMSGELFNFSLQIAAPVAISIFSVNVVFGIISKVMPQLNILVLSLTVTALIGFLVLFFSMSGFQTLVESILIKMKEWLEIIMLTMGNRG